MVEKANNAQNAKFTNTVNIQVNDPCASNAESHATFELRKRKCKSSLATSFP